MIDKEVIYKHIGELRKIVNELSSFESYTLHDLEIDIGKQWQIERGLQLAIQNLLDIGSHILSALGKNNIETYTDIIDKLAQEKILPPDFTLKIRGMAGLRNILVHDYLDVDIGRIYKIFQDQLEDFKTFCRLIIEYLEQ
jgi:uncharacterized protein YutE (UPF0331/DUF86 family)